MKKTPLKKTRPETTRLLWSGGTLLAATLALTWAVRNEAPVPASASPARQPAHTTLEKPGHPASALAPSASKSAAAITVAKPGIHYSKDAGLALRQTKWAAELKEITATEEPARSDKIRSFIADVPVEDLLAAMDFFRGNPFFGPSGDISSGLLRRLAKLDPETASISVENMAPGTERITALNDVAVIWSNLDITKAADWVKQWPDEKERQGGLITVAYEAARTDAIGAMSLAIDLPPSKDRDALIDHTAAQWAATSPDDAAKWAQTIPDTDLRAQVLERISTEWATQNPVAAATLAVTQLPSGRIQNDAIVGIVARWVQTDPKGATDWVTHFPEGPLRQTAMESIKKLSPKPLVD
ncbi:MAG TPA: hypothetical protein VL357_12780 [Rariglobus sp.]|jgi:hypothetical protein|nr:hypothetical protein [Rariglobus sp.]